MIWAMRFPPRKRLLSPSLPLWCPKKPQGLHSPRLCAAWRHDPPTRGSPETKHTKPWFFVGNINIFGDTIGMLFFLERVMGYDAIIYRKPRKYNLNDIHNFPRSKKTRFPTNRAFETTPTNRMQHKPKCSGMEFSSFTTRITQIHVHI
jgi:hypothetical protein